MRLLILGGTSFLGPAQVAYAQARGHTVTLFNRGRTNPHLFPDVEKLVGDRDHDLRALEGREWDAVIDNSATVPRWVRQSAALLRDAVGRYLYVSSLSVYATPRTAGIDETGTLATLDDPTAERITGSTYGGMKVASEHEAQTAFGARALVVRPGLIVGPMDRTDRFTYWPVRIDRGGAVLAPGDPTDPVQLIDVRDLGEWMVRMIEADASGVYNATGPEAPLNVSEMLYGIKAVTSTPVRFTWIDADFLRTQRVRPWSDLPVWMPPRGDNAGFSQFSSARALADGLTFRSLAVTARDTIDWFARQPAVRRATLRAGLTAERERAVLAAWHTTNG